MTTNTVYAAIDWRIPNFEAVDDKMTFSPAHTVATDKMEEIPKWQLLLFPRGNSRRHPGYVSLFLRLYSCDTQKIDVKYFQFSIVDNQNHHRQIMTVVGRTFTAEEPDYGYSEYIKRSELLSPAENLLDDGELHLSCIFEIEIPSDQQNPSRHLDEAQPGCSSSSQRELLWQQFVDQKYTDVKFIVGNQEFNLHKVVMAACPIFASMFDSQLKEGRENQVTITDTEPEVFKEMVRYIYTGKVENLNDVAKQLIIAADKYAIEDLVKKCEVNIRNNLAVQNVAENLQLADLLGLEMLKKSALQFIKDNAADVMKTDGYQNLGTNLIKEVAQLLVEFIAELKNK